MEAAHLPWRPLGQLLVDEGLLTPEQLEEALDNQATTGRRLGEIAVEFGFVSHMALSRVLSAQYGVELKSEDMKEMKTVGDAVDLIVARSG